MTLKTIPLEEYATLEFEDQKEHHDYVLDVWNSSRKTKSRNEDKINLIKDQLYIIDRHPPCKTKERERIELDLPIRKRHCILKDLEEATLKVLKKLNIPNDCVDIDNTLFFYDNDCDCWGIRLPEPIKTTENNYSYEEYIMESDGYKKDIDELRLENEELDNMIEASSDEYLIIKQLYLLVKQKQDEIAIDRKILEAKKLLNEHGVHEFEV